MDTGLYKKCWTEASVGRYFTSEAMSKTREAFNEVHLPIDRILVDPEYPAARGQKEISESQLSAIITKSRPDQPNRIFLIVGDTGSGKSELCQWLNYNIRDGIHVPILIERRMIRLAEIVEEIHRHLGEPMPADMIEITDLWPETVSARLRAAVLMHLQQPHVQNALGQKDIVQLRKILETPEFEGRMRHHFTRYCDELQHLERIRQLQLLPESDFRDLALLVEGVHDPSACYSQIQRAMTDCLAGELQVEDLMQKLERLSKSYRSVGKRPVLLIEDITTFGFLQNDLLDYLYNLAGGNYDVIMGITTGFEQENKGQIYKAQQTITERIEGRFELTDRSNETVFLREKHIELAQRYLDAVQKGECGESPEWLVLMQAFDNGLYPFNEAFLRKIYRNLHQANSRKQTPRLYLRAIQGVLESDLAPYDAIELNSNVNSPATYLMPDSSVDQNLENLLKWYGRDTNVGVFLSERIAAMFDVAVPPHIPRVNGFFCFRLRSGVERYLPSPPPFLEVPGVPEHSPTGKSKKTPAPPLPPPDNTQTSLDVIAQLDEWLALKGQFPDRNTFKDGVNALLQFYQFEPFDIKHPDSIAVGGVPLTFERGDKYAKLYLHHSADDKPYHKLVIRPDLTRRDLFGQVLAIGSGGYDVTDATSLDHAQLYDWLEACVAELRKEMYAALAQALRMPLERFVAFTKFLLINLTSCDYTLQPETLIQPITEEPLALPGMGNQGRQLWENRDHIQALFVALFHYRENLANYPLLQQTTADMDPEALLQELERIDVEAISTGFRTRLKTSEVQFRDLVRLVKNYVAFLRTRVRAGNHRLDPVIGDIQRVLRYCTPRGSIDPAKLASQLDITRQMANAHGIDWSSVWDLGLTPLYKSPEALDFARFHDDLTELLTHIGGVSEPLPIFTYLAFQRRINLVYHRPEYEVLNTIMQMYRPITQACARRESADPSQVKFIETFRRVCRDFQEAVKL